VDALQRLLDRQAIVDVIHAYCRNVDLLDAAAVAALFTEDCVVDYGPGLGQPTHGSATLEQRLAIGLPRFAATSHHVSNIEVAFAADGDSATTITYLYAWHRYPDDRPDATLWARYHDRFVRRGERWMIAERTLRVAGQQDFDVEWHPIGRQA
jgi:ketosteroid isomerase-like protein